MNERRKVLVIGLDGMTAVSLLPLIKDGQMPFMGQLIDRGAFGTLLSTIPPVTGPAWTTFFTGRNPGSHGILDFFRVTSDGQSRRLINSREVHGKTLWEILNENGKTQIVVNTPLTYPPTPVEGAMITGMLTPNTNSDMTHPPDLYSRLKPELGEYVITVNWQDYSEESATGFLGALRECNRQRTRYVLRLMDDIDWDFTMATYTGTDRVHHALWHYVDPAERAKLGPAFDPGVMEGVNSYFRQLDDNIRRIVTKAGPETAVFFISDHGFGPLLRKVYINNWLEKQGLLKIRHGRLKAYQAATLGMRLASKIMRRVKSIPLLNRIKPKAKQRAALANFAFYHIFYGSIDWSRTKAYMASNSEQGIYVNLAGREPFGSVDPADYDRVRDEVQEALQRLENDEGKPLLSHFYRREEIYAGPCTERAPDVIFFLDEGAYLAEIQLGGGKLFRDISWRTGTGNHRLEGILLAAGPDIRSTRDYTTKLINVMPTILHYMGIPIPTDLDGSLIEEVFTEEFRADREPVYEGASMAGVEDGDGDEGVFSEREEGELQDRLRRLGYMD